MDLRYNSVSDTIQDVNEDVFHPVKDSSTSIDFTESFLKRHCPAITKQDYSTALAEIAYHCIDLSPSSRKKHLKKKTGNGTILRKHKKKLLSYKEKRKFKVFDIAEDKQRYILFEPLHQLWLSYIQDVIDFKQYDKDLLGANQRNTELKLLRADYHGCIMKVVSAKCSTLLDLEGILLMETKNTWKIITTSDAIKVIPKKNTVVSIQVHDYIFKIHGSNFICKTGERSSRPFKKFLNLK